MADLNSVNIVGRLTRDIQIRKTPGGTSVAEIGLANNSRVKRGDNWEDKVSFIDIVCFGRAADSCAEHLSKGSQIAVSGRLDMDTWDDKQTGQKRSKMRVVAESIQYLDKKPGGGSRQQKDEPPPDEDQPF